MSLFARKNSPGVDEVIELQATAGHLGMLVASDLAAWHSHSPRALAGLCPLPYLVPGLFQTLGLLVRIRPPCVVFRA